MGTAGVGSGFVGFGFPISFDLLRAFEAETGLPESESELETAREVETEGEP
jgi:hypothetical protein